MEDQRRNECNEVGVTGETVKNLYRLSRDGVPET